MRYLSIYLQIAVSDLLCEGKYAELTYADVC